MARASRPDTLVPTCTETWRVSRGPDPSPHARAAAAATPTTSRPARRQHARGVTVRDSLARLAPESGDRLADLMPSVTPVTPMISSGSLKLTSAARAREGTHRLDPDAPARRRPAPAAPLGRGWGQPKVIAASGLTTEA